MAQPNSKKVKDEYQKPIEDLGINGSYADWNRWGMYVLMELKENKETHRALDIKLDLIHDDVLMLKTKAAVWGSVGGGVFGLITGFLIKLLA